MALSFLQFFYTVESPYVKLGILEISAKSKKCLKSRFKLEAFRLNLLLLSQISIKCVKISGFSK